MLPFCFRHQLLPSRREREPRAFTTKGAYCCGRHCGESGGFSSFLLFLPPYFVSFFVKYFRRFALKLMVIEGILEGIKSILGEDNLTKIREDFAISLSVRLEVLGPFERMIMRSVNWMAIHEDLLLVGP